MSKKKLSQEEQVELFQLMLFGTLQKTSVADWKAPPNEFVKLAIPKQLTDFLKQTSNPDDVLRGVLIDLICRGIGEVLKEAGSPEHIKLLIKNIFAEADKEQ